jgi:uncharacterized protein involved in outer membrane biogenesis
MKVFWTILGIAGAVVVIVVVGVAIAVWTLDVNQFVGPLQARVKAATGRDLGIGHVGIGIGLVPKIVATDVRFGNAPWGREPQMATAKRVEAEVALLPLLSRRVEIIELKLVDPVIALETDAHGKGNWDFGTGPASAPSGPAGAAVVPAAALAAFGIGNVEISNGLVTYRDGTSDAVTRVVIDRFSAASRSASSPINAEFTGKVDDVPVALTGNLGSLETLLARKAPYPIAVEGKVGEQKTNLSTKVSIGDNVVKLEDVDVGVGASKAKAQAIVTTGGPRPRLAVNVNATTLALADLALPVVAAGVAVPKPLPAAATPATLFSDEPVSFAALRSVDADGDVAIGELRLKDGGKLEQVHARFTIRDGRLDAPDVTATMYGGSVRAALTIDAAKPADPTVALTLDGKGLDLAAMLAASGNPHDVKGGKTDVALKLSMHGTTTRQWAHDVSGSVLTVVGPASVSNAKLDPARAMSDLLQKVNPLRERSPTTELKCAVVRIPLHDGVGRIDRSLAAESSEVSVSASGTLDLRSETIDLAFTPRMQQGIPVNLNDVAGLVHLKGPLVAPRVEVDAQAAAETVSRLAAAAKGGGLAGIGAAMLAPPSTAGGANVCDIALGKAAAVPAPAAQTAAPAAAPAGVPADLGKALGQLLHR